MRILALDIGTKRIGIAISDPGGIIAQPLETIAAQESSSLENIYNIVKQYDVGLIVYGYPLSKDGSENIQVEFTKSFIEKLGAIVDIELRPIDERFTSKIAERLIRGTKFGSIEEKRGSIDRIAAAVLLQEYLDSRTDIKRGNDH